MKRTPLFCRCCITYPRLFQRIVSEHMMKGVDMLISLLNFIKTRTHPRLDGIALCNTLQPVSCIKCIKV